MHKTASKLERALVAAFQRAGKTLDLQTAARATGRRYPRGYRTLAEFVNARDVAVQGVLPSIRKYRMLTKNPVSLRDIAASYRRPLYRGTPHAIDTAATISDRGKNYIREASAVDKVIPGLGDPYHKDPLLSRMLYGTRLFYTPYGDAATVHTFRNGKYIMAGDAAMRIAELDSAGGRKAISSGRLVFTPNVHGTNSRWRKAISDAVRTGRLNPDTDLKGVTHYGKYGTLPDFETTVTQYDIKRIPHRDYLITEGPDKIHAAPFSALKGVPLTSELVKAHKTINEMLDKYYLKRFFNGYTPYTLVHGTGIPRHETGF